MKVTPEFARSIAVGAVAHSAFAFGVGVASFGFTGGSIGIVGALAVVGHTSVAVTGVLLIAFAALVFAGLVCQIVRELNT